VLPYIPKVSDIIAVWTFIWAKNVSRKCWTWEGVGHLQRLLPFILRGWRAQYCCSGRVSSFFKNSHPHSLVRSPEVEELYQHSYYLFKLHFNNILPPTSNRYFPSSLRTKAL
jgi:hypothetical protein